MKKEKSRKRSWKILTYEKSKKEIYIRKDKIQIKFLKVKKKYHTHFKKKNEIAYFCSKEF